MNCNRNSQTITNLISQGYNSWTSFDVVGMLYQLLIQNALVLKHIKGPPANRAIFKC